MPKTGKKEEGLRDNAPKRANPVVRVCHYARHYAHYTHTHTRARTHVYVYTWRYCDTRGLKFEHIIPLIKQTQTQFAQFYVIEYLVYRRESSASRKCSRGEREKEEESRGRAWAGSIPGRSIPGPRIICNEIIPRRVVCRS